MEVEELPLPLDAPSVMTDTNVFMCYQRYSGEKMVSPSHGRKYRCRPRQKVTLNFKSEGYLLAELPLQGEGVFFCSKTCN